ncbi:MAG: cation-transporting P-type ATPase [Burkholderiales bacterium]
MNDAPLPEALATASGLTARDAATRLREEGPNALPTAERRSLFAHRSPRPARADVPPALRGRRDLSADRRRARSARACRPYARVWPSFPRSSRSCSRSFSRWAPGASRGAVCS